MKYKIEWKSIDQGVEHTMDINVLLNGIKSFSRHQPVYHRDPTSPWYAEMTSLYPNHTWVNTDSKDGSARPIFRRSNSWLKLQLIEEHVLKGRKAYVLSDLGQQVSNGAVSLEDVFTNVMIHHDEDGENPFKVFSDILLRSYPSSLEPEQLLYLCANYREGDDFSAILSSLSPTTLDTFLKSIESANTRIRRTRSILNLLVNIDAVSVMKRSYRASDLDLLKGICAGRIDEVSTLFDNQSPPKAPPITADRKTTKRLLEAGKSVSSFNTNRVNVDYSTKTALLEKATRNHEAAIGKLISFLAEHDIQSYDNPNGYDLFATRPDGIGLLFEIKSIKSSNIQKQIRSAIAQLYEYEHRFKDELASELVLAIVLDRSPLTMLEPWTYSYLFETRKILLLWWDEAELKTHMAYQSSLDTFIQQLNA